MDEREASAARSSVQLSELPDPETSRIRVEETKHHRGAAGVRRRRLLSRPRRRDPRDDPPHEGGWMPLGPPLARSDTQGH